MGTCCIYSAGSSAQGSVVTYMGGMVGDVQEGGDICILIADSNHFTANIWGSNGNSDRLFPSAPKSLQIVTAAMKLKDTCSLEEKLSQT